METTAVSSANWTRARRGRQHPGSARQRSALPQRPYRLATAIRLLLLSCHESRFTRNRFGPMSSQRRRPSPTPTGTSKRSKRNRLQSLGGWIRPRRLHLWYDNRFRSLRQVRRAPPYRLVKALTDSRPSGSSLARGKSPPPRLPPARPSISAEVSTRMTLRTVRYSKGSARRRSRGSKRRCENGSCASGD